MNVNYFAVLFERIFHVFDMSSYALCVRVRVRVGRLTFDSREASSLLEADIGVAVHEIMGIMNRVKHRPRGQYFSQRAGEKKKKDAERCELLDITLFPADRREVSAKKHRSFGPDVYLFNNLKRLSAGPAAGTPSVGGCPRQARANWAFSHAGRREKRKGSRRLMSWLKGSCVLNMLGYCAAACVWLTFNVGQMLTSSPTRLTAVVPSILLLISWARPDFLPTPSWTADGRKKRRVWHFVWGNGRFQKSSTTRQNRVSAKFHQIQESQSYCFGIPAWII